MPDREKVIEGLQKIIADDWIWKHADYYASLISDALDILKEQDAKTGTWQWKIHGRAESGGTLGEAICDQCGKSTYATAVKGDLNYCPNCGAKMTDRR